MVIQIPDSRNQCNNHIQGQAVLLESQFVIETFVPSTEGEM